VSVDSQSGKTTECGGERGYDGGKKISGRKRNLLVDTLGLLLAVTVTSAAMDDAAAADFAGLSFVPPGRRRCRSLNVVFSACQVWP